jgi:hypothetical protein
MPKLEAHLNKLGFTPEETRLAVSIEQIIFTINRKVSAGKLLEGVTIETLKNELNKIENMKYSDELISQTIEKCIENHILTQREGKYYSITYYGK